ncbi:MAG: hypothetical protein RL637_8 [Pseudomonadota bacterium]|jgi:uncharacterized DUF497 family protein
MKLVFDENKNAINIAKHGVSLADAEKIEWKTLLAIEDKRHDYGEIRIIGYALIESRLYCVVFTDRENERRIISLRKANSREVKNYVINS